MDAVDTFPLLGGVEKFRHPSKNSVNTSVVDVVDSAIQAYSGALHYTIKECCRLYPLLTGFLWGLGQLHYTSKEPLGLYPLRFVLGAIGPPRPAKKGAG
jgi:hypothetical protein